MPHLNGRSFQTLKEQLIQIWKPVAFQTWQATLSPRRQSLLSHSHAVSNFQVWDDVRNMLARDMWSWLRLGQTNNVAIVITSETHMCSRLKGGYLQSGLIWGVSFSRYCCCCCCCWWLFCCVFLWLCADIGVQRQLGACALSEKRYGSNIPQLHFHTWA